jgi:hypothetical protein
MSEYSTDLNGQFLELVHTICETEADAGLAIGLRTIGWATNPSIFAEPLRIHSAFLDHPPEAETFKVKQFELWFPEEEIQISVKQDDKTPPLEADPFMEYYLEKGHAIFDVHEHDLCVVAFTKRNRAIAERNAKNSTRLSWLERASN